MAKTKLTVVPKEGEHPLPASLVARLQPLQTQIANAEAQRNLLLEGYFAGCVDITVHDVHVELGVPQPFYRVTPKKTETPA